MSGNKPAVKKHVDGIIGTRPNMMKMAPLARKIAEEGTFELRLIHTGQHYDEQMSQVFLAELGLPEPAYNFHVGSGRQGAQTARILERYEDILCSDQRPEGVIVVGDVTSTMACALAAVKMGVPVAHVEAGLRSNDRSMPEEINRVVTDAVSDILFVSDPDGLMNLAREGQPSAKVSYVGNIMMDTLFHELPYAERSTILTSLGVSSYEYVYLTLHRPSNVDDPLILNRIMHIISDIAREITVVFAIHPRTRAMLDQAGITPPISDRLRVSGPLSYRDNLRVQQCARAVFTDSGGIQEETSVLNVPCVTLRETTERPVTTELGSSELAGSDEARIWNAWERIRAGHWKQASTIPLWDGQTAGRIVQRLHKSWA
jgi:UDP-N-acetylglucosamine 2-epimerase (non-hydrolysing)